MCDKYTKSDRNFKFSSQTVLAVKQFFAVLSIFTQNKNLELHQVPLRKQT